MAIADQTPTRVPPRLLTPSWDNFKKYDGPAGLVVFLVALPLCLGIALASGAPLFSGVIAGIVGGLVVALLSGSHVSVSGPAAGLTMIVFVAIQQLGFPAFLTAVALAGVMQFLLGTVGAGVLGDYVPNSVIKGMLAAIGLVIILKQIPHALGRDKDYEGDFAFFEAGDANTLTDILSSIASASPGAVIVSVVSLVVLLSWDSLAAKGHRFFMSVPGPLAAVVLGIGINALLGAIAPSWKIVEASHMVQLPISTSLPEFFSQFSTPDFSAIVRPEVWIVAVTLALVASVESLLAIEAADKLDPFRRVSPPNQELRAQGVGNLVSGLIGGLPLTTVIVRTSANVSAGARTKVAAITHSVLLLLSALLIPQLLNLTPLASLAVVLIMVGYKLTKMNLYKSMFRLGWDQFLPFIITVVAIVFTDLLKGVAVGLVAGILFVIRANHRSPISLVNQDDWYLLRFNKDLTFVNKSQIRSTLNGIPDGSKVIIEGTRAGYIDRDVFEVVEDYQRSAPYRNITVELKNVENRWI